MRRPARWVCLASLIFVLASATAIADDDETETPVRTIGKSQCICLVKASCNLWRIKQLNEEISKRFPSFESDVLSDSPTFFAEDGQPRGKSYGVGLWIAFPDVEEFVCIALPLNAGELLEDEDYELGEDEQGNATVSGQRVATSKHYFGFPNYSDGDVVFEGAWDYSKETISFVERTEDWICAIQTSPTQIGRSPLGKSIAGFRIGLDTAAQRQDEETDFDYSWRSITEGHLARVTELFFKDVEECEMLVSGSGNSDPLTFELNFTCRRKSELLAYLQELHKRRNRALSWLHPSASAFATVSIALPKKIQDQLQIAGKLTADAGRAEGLSDAAAAQVQLVLSKPGNSGAIELLIQKVQFDSRSECYVALMPQDSMTDLHPEVVQLVSGVDGHSAIRDVEGWSVFSAEEWLDLDLPEDWSCLVLSTDSVVAFVWTKEEDEEQTFEFLKELVTRDFTPTDKGIAITRAILAAEFSLTDVLAPAGEFVDDGEPYLPVTAEPSENGGLNAMDNDQVRMTISLNDNKLGLRVQFEPNAVAFGVTMIELFINTVGEFILVAQFTRYHVG